MFFGQEFPGALMVVAMSQGSLEPSEIALLSPIATAGRKVDKKGRMASPMMILTGNELLGSEHLIQSWKAKGGFFSHYSDRNIYHFRP